MWKNIEKIKKIKKNTVHSNLCFRLSTFCCNKKMFVFFLSFLKEQFMYMRSKMIVRTQMERVWILSIKIEFDILVFFIE